MEPTPLPSQASASPDRVPGSRLIDARPRLVLVLLCLALWLPGFFSLPPTDRDESRFAQATKQMLETGDFVRTMNGTLPRNRKPIGIHWLQAPFAAAARAAGVAAGNPIWPYRVPSVLGGIAAVLATYSLGLTLLAERRAALLAAAMLASCVILTVEAHIAKTDAALLGATTVAMAVLAQAWRGLPLGRVSAASFWLALGAGVLIKGPISPMVLGCTVLAASLAGRRWRWLAALRPQWGVGLLLLVVLPWFVAIGLATHGRFFSDALGGDMARKLAGGEESHGFPPGWHLLLLPLLAFPATVPVICGLKHAWHRRRDEDILFLLAWLVPAWLIFEAVPTKLPHYTLPLYPALCLLAAAWLAAPVAGKLPLVAGILAAIAGIGIGAAAMLVPPLLHLPVWLGVPAALCGALAAWFAARHRITPAIATCIVLYGAVLQLELPLLAPVWLAPRIVALLRRAAPQIGADGAGIVTAGYDEPSLMFLGGTRLTAAPTGQAAARELARLPEGVAVVTADNLAGLLQVSARRGLIVRPLGVIDGVNMARGRAVQLTVAAASHAGQPN